MNDDDLHLWSGLYATDALTADERARYEEHLAGCPDCRAEVAGFHDTAALLAAAVATAPSSEVRARVLAEVATTRQDPPPAPDHEAGDADDLHHEPTVVPLARPGRRRVARWLVAAAAAVLLLGGLGVLLSGRGSSDPTEAELVAGVLARADARVITLKGEDRAPLKLVWSPSAGEGAVLGDDLAAVDEDETYELWAIADGEPAQVALFRPDERGVVRSHFATDLRRADAVGVTVEPAGGSEAPTTPIVLSSTVS
ncbi:MAG: anti-sigma factor [Acidimicrobiales bacterium]